MKIHHVLMAVCLVLFAVSTGTAQDKKLTTTEFTVSGNCGMCKKTIESSLKGKPGISAADWNTSTKLIKVSYDPSVVSEEQIQQKIADVGYDTQMKRASDKSYNSLMGCCKYKRTLHTTVN